MKPIYLEPMSVSLRRFGREMGTSDIPASELVRDALPPGEATRVLDRIMSARDVEAADRHLDDIQRRELFSTHCYSCAARNTPFGTNHADDCDLDRTLNCQERWRLRNPWFQTKQNRIAFIRRRWAAINGRCSFCAKEPARDGFRWCASCIEKDRARRPRVQREPIETESRAA